MLIDYSHIHIRTRIFLDLILRTEPIFMKICACILFEFRVQFLFTPPPVIWHWSLLSTIKKVSFSPLFCSFILSPLWNYSTPFRPLTQYVDRPIHTNILARNFQLLCLLEFKTFRALRVTLVNSGHKYEFKKKFA